jgi:3-hydroxyacyl-CoA dehydrogenase
MGLYQFVRYENGARKSLVYDIGTGNYRDVIQYAFPFAVRMKRLLSEGDYQKALGCLVDNRSQEAKLCLSFLLKYIVYALYAAEEVAFGSASADDVMATGFNWCPPLAMYQALSSVTDVPALVRERIPEVYGKVDVNRLFSGIAPSKYDYRVYFKSGR